MLHKQPVSVPGTLNNIYSTHDGISFRQEGAPSRSPLQQPGLSQDDEIKAMFQIQKNQFKLLEELHARIRGLIINKAG